LRFVDANVLIHAAVEQDPAEHARSLALIGRIQRAQEQVHITDIVMVEVAVNLRSARAGRLSKQQVADFLLPLTQMDSVEIAYKSAWRRVFDLYVGENLDLGDAHIAALMEAKGESELYSFDTDFDRIPGITRLEP
jgi:predicted nucleic acid-binding protein